MYKIEIKKNSNIKHVKFYNDKFEFLETPVEKDVKTKTPIDFHVNKSDILWFENNEIYFEIENGAEWYYVQFKDIDITNDKWISQTKKTIERLVLINND